MALAPRLLLAPCLALVLLVSGLSGGAANADPGAYRVMIVHATCQSPTELGDQIAAFPDVAAVDFFDGCKEAPTSSQLLPYDLVVSMSYIAYEDQVAYGDALAAFVDSGGAVVQYAYDSAGEGESDYGPTGRFHSGGYEPFIPGPVTNKAVTLGEFDSTSPLMQGVTALSSAQNTDPALAPGAVLVAKWSDGRNLIAQKGRVVSVSGHTGDKEEWSGDYGRLTVNAVRLLGRQKLTVVNSTPGGGTVTSSPAGIVCETFSCGADFPSGTSVTLIATPRKGFAFAGFRDDCRGPSCVLTMDGPKTVPVDFIRFAVLVHSKLRRNTVKGTARITIRVGGPGMLVLTGRGVRRQTRAPAAASNVKMLIVAKGKVAKKLRRKGSAKLGVRVAFTPSAGTTARLSRQVRLIRAARR
jgi:hypothetical protein